MTTQKRIQHILALAVVCIGVTLVAWAEETETPENFKLTKCEDKAEVLAEKLKSFTDDEALQKQRIATFDELDFDFYSNQKWDKFNHSHADNIKVYYPDGSTTTGLFPQHIDMLTPLFVFAPDTKIKEHPIAFGRGEWTCVVGELEGTFSAPMPIGNGKTLPPTGKKFKLRMATIGKWGADGKMTEEYLFWDNQSLLKQIGLAE
ncbi:ester cyclase [Sulfurovum sp. zt1-1]|uniref:Ester cyclase n=1 Tax=Sulfurovum zhangzhouensis TaxID=3019067 RepID=A0ABT7QY31_9BACT|nr:ester cyclase [Sulfurovum zhangzhouensis]MDM5271702.1 ester cyclase [Sulfurovum zhangzhouensis]